MKYKKLSGILLPLLIFSTVLLAEEGMYPVSEIKNLNLTDKGLLISPSDIYNPKGISIVNGICKVGGATGSFISKRGLIITNHHVAYGAIQAASTPEHDYITNGYYARTEVKMKFRPKVMLYALQTRIKMSRKRS